MVATRTEQDWLDSVRALILRGNTSAAQGFLNQALAEFPASTDLLRAQAGVFQQTGRNDAAEHAFRALLAHDFGDTGSAFALAGLLNEQGRTAAAAEMLRACLAVESNARNPDRAISAIELLDEMDRKRDAAAIAEAAIAGQPDDARLHAYAGMLDIQLGEFERARTRYLFALQNDSRAFEWHVPIGLSSAQRYTSAGHPDFALFREALKRDGLSDLARAELHFALGKAHDDIGAYEEAARHFLEGNAIRKHTSKWSRKNWLRMIEARLAAKPIAVAPAPLETFTPVFIVGMPRSGTTLLAELLSHCPNVCNRGELPWIARLTERYGLNGNPDRAELQRAAAAYVSQSRRDDAGDAHWFIDKQPLNFRYIDLMLALFPDARIIHCQRNPRDTALSLWMQCFLEDVQGYAYDFSDIAQVMRDCERLMTHWNRRFAESIRTIRYEDLVSDTRGVIEPLAQWIGLPPRTPDDAAARPAASISTASLWQARQPVNTESIGRWKNYAPHVPELMRIPDA